MVTKSGLYFFCKNEYDRTYPRRKKVRRMKKLGNILFIVVFVALLAVFVYSGWSLYSYFRESAQSQNTYNELESLLQQEMPSQQYDPQLPSGSGDPSSSTQTTEQAPAVDPYVTVTDPDTGEEIQILRQYQTLYSLNPDLVGWIRIPGTNISYPVVQSEQNNKDYYLRRDYYGKSDSHGCIYVREQCDVFAPSDNCTIYGHRMKDGTMFAELANYEDKTFWEQHPYIEFDTLTEPRTYQIFAVFITTASVGEGFRYHQFVDAGDASDFNQFVQQCKQLSLYDTSISAQPGDKLITLSTCEYTQENGRLVVVAKLLTQ